jgi:hypothetical protein
MNSCVPIDQPSLMIPRPLRCALRQLPAALWRRWAQALAVGRKGQPLADREVLRVGCSRYYFKERFLPPPLPPPDNRRRILIVCPYPPAPPVHGGAVRMLNLIKNLSRDNVVDVLSFLVVRWVSLQDPLGRFAPDKPRLPGQRYPGLGLGRVVFERLLAWATAWGKDGLLNLPEYFHNAVFYSAMFRFLAPARQGRFEALRRDLAGLHVAEASAAVEAGRVREQPGNRSLRWEPGEMAAPIAAGLRDYLDSEEYAKAVAAASAAVSYRLA